MPTPAPARAGSLDPPQSPARARTTVSPEPVPAPAAVRASPSEPEKPPAAALTPTPADPRAAREASAAPSEDADDESAAEGEPDGDAPDATPTIDLETFLQILDLDEDETHEFSKEMVWQYFSQASTTFVEMDDAYTHEDLVKLSSLGHFLKGSSAALGVTKVQASCEQIQHYGQKRDEATGQDLEADAALEKIGPLLARVKKEYAAAEDWLKDWYRKNDPKDG
ncbi:histidine-phosphotransfer domain, HPT domain-containing protein [Obba rivulosa]|uniref:Histidine-phosphotransfer domain, HPT domain-containing protein n=1 Tax=Obba rivulosa TaxID=1052685 RepID=A0A8E2B2T4_9APHY|nr:histidine-phosphotransfer domain, HPT domain-containing protein [Obba rivulosa]